MKRIILLLFILIQVTTLRSQNELPDSIITKLKQATTDSAKLKIAFNIPLGAFTPQQCLQAARLLIEEAEHTNNDLLLAKGWVSLGYGYYKSGNIAKALEADLKALRIAENKFNATLMTEIYNNLGLSFETIDIEKAKTYFLKSIEIVREKSGNWAGVVFPNFARFLLKQNQIDSAINYANEYRELSQKSNIRVEKTYSYNSVMSSISQANNQFALAIVYGKTALSDAEASNSPYRIATCNLLIAKSFANADSSFNYYYKVYRISEKYNIAKDLIVSSDWLYQYYLKKNSSDSTIKYMQIWRSAKDSLEAQNKTVDIQSLAFEEKLREKELTEAYQKEKEERNHNIQLAITAIAILSVIILFLLLSRSILVSHKVVEFLSVLVLLVVFEFINLLIHPFLENITHHSPVLMLLGLVAIASLIIPLHHRLEHWTTHKLVEKNKAIRLANAKKTIEELESGNEKR